MVRALPDATRIGRAATVARDKIVRTAHAHLTTTALGMGVAVRAPLNALTLKSAMEAAAARARISPMGLAAATAPPLFATIRTPVAAAPAKAIMRRMVPAPADATGIGRAPAVVRDKHAAAAHANLTTTPQDIRAPAGQGNVGQDPVTAAAVVPTLI